MENAAPAKKKTSSLKLFFLIVLGFLLLSFVLQQSGLKVMKTNEKEEILDRPHAN